MASEVRLLFDFHGWLLARRKGFIALVVFILLVLAFLPIPGPMDGGAYNTWSGLYWCKGEKECIHERGHALDHKHGWPSVTPEYLQAVQIYVMSEMENGKPEPTARIIINTWCKRYRWGTNPNLELYAEIYAFAGGNIENIPPSLQEFYK